MARNKSSAGSLFPNQTQQERKRAANIPWYTSGVNDKGPPLQDNPNTREARRLRAEWQKNYAAG